MWVGEARQRIPAVINCLFQPIPNFFAPLNSAPGSAADKSRAGL